MSVLTKISVVILVVLILLACPVFIRQATVAPNYRFAYDRELMRNKLLGMGLNEAKLSNEKLKAERDAAISEKNRTIAQKQTEVDRLTAELSAWQTKAAEQENNLKRLTVEVAGLKNEAVTFNRRNDMLASQLDETRTEINKLAKELIRVGELLKQAEAGTDRFEKLAKVRAERITELEEENEQLRQTGTGVARRGEETTPMPTELITGTVTAVRGDYASINIGSAKGITRGMKMIIYRGTQLIAFLRIEDVEIGQAAGIIIDRQVNPMQGDKVTTSLQS